MIVDVALLFAYKVFLAVLPIGTVVFLGWVAWKMWIHYVQQDFISGIEYVLLEIIPPRDVPRSPKAMELFFTNALYHWSMKGGLEEWWQGAVWFWFSLEIASIEGQVHFYIRTPSRIKELIETQMYAQYPQAQVKVVEDYTLDVDEISPTSSWMGWGCEFKLLKHEAYPIKTYVDYGLDKDPDEEVKVDPISPVIELFGSLKKGEQMWVQMVVRPSKKEYKGDHGTHNWVKESRRVLEEMVAPYTKFNEDKVHGGYTKEVRAPSFLDGIVKAMAAKVTKIGFDTGVRAVYVAKKEAYDLRSRRNIRLIFRQYAKPDCNEFYRINGTQADYYGGIFLASPETVMHISNRILLEISRAFIFPYATSS
jgi:hypothetical protein